MGREREHTPLEKLCRDGLVKIQMSFRDPLTAQEMDFYVEQLINEDRITENDWPATVRRVCRLDFMRTPSLGIIRRELAEVRRQMIRPSGFNSEPDNPNDPWIPREEAMRLIGGLIEELSQKLESNSTFERIKLPSV